MQKQSSVWIVMETRIPKMITISIVHHFKSVLKINMKLYDIFLFTICGAIGRIIFDTDHTTDIINKML